MAALTIHTKNQEENQENKMKQNIPAISTMTVKPNKLCERKLKKSHLSKIEQKSNFNVQKKKYRNEKKK